MGGELVARQIKGINALKYLAAFCLSLALLITITINLLRTYSFANTNANAEPNLSDNNLKTPGEATISLSVHSSTNSCDTSVAPDTGSNDANICLIIPPEGGLAVGRHTVTVRTSSLTGYEVHLNYADVEANDYGALINTENNKSRIQNLGNGRLDMASTRELDDNTYGYAVPDYAYFNSADVYENLLKGVNSSGGGLWLGVTKSGDDVDSPIIQSNSPTSDAGYSQNVYFGVRVDNPTSLQAGNYSTQVVYTATAKLPPAPTITSTTPNTYELGSNTNMNSNNRYPVTITGANLASTYKIYLTSSLDDTIQYDLTDYATSITDKQLVVTLPTDQTNPNLAAGEYTIHLITQGGKTSTKFTYARTQTLSVYDQTDNVQVDWDSNMIPVYYTGNSSTPRWTSLSQTQIEQNLTTWFDYSGSRTADGIKWANAVTVKDPSKYKGKSLVVDQADILGYWVYIPRYAYKVLRRDAIDAPVTAQNFDIRFETIADTKKHPAATCSTATGHRNYLDCTSSAYPTSDYLVNQSAWATHPAFTWTYTEKVNGFNQTIELNGIWVAKFEMTGSTTSPTVLPQQFRKGSMPIGTLYDIVKSIGVTDQNNPYGNSTSTTSNNHHLSTMASHVSTNNEWGATAYLSASKYGAGVTGVLPNSAIDAGTDGDGLGSTGLTGCGPADSTSLTQYTCLNNTSHYYYGNIGKLASTTGNVYGVYDMSGGGREFTMGIRSTQASGIGENSTYFATPPRSPYANIYSDSEGFGAKPSWSQSTDSQFFNNDVCTWETCGGQAIHETKTIQSVINSEQSWNQDYSQFAYGNYIYFGRGGNFGGGTKTGLFSTGRSDGNGQYYDGIRAVIANTPTSRPQQ